MRRFFKTNPTCLPMNIFNLTTRPNPELFLSRNDPNDLKMGEFVTFNPDDYDRANYVILGCPQDQGVVRNKGREGTRDGPDEIRRALYKFSVPTTIRNASIFDLGDVLVDRSLEDIHELHYRLVYQILSDGKIAIVLGGGNDISFPDCAALSQVSNRLMAFNIDSHYDVRSDDPPNSGTPYRQLLEGGYLAPQRFYQLANKPFTNSPRYEAYLVEKGVHLYPLQKLREIGISTLLDDVLSDSEPDAIFWGFDMDSVRTVDAPGVSASYPVGLSAEEICAISHRAGSDPRSRVLEISEVNPRFDVDQRTCKLAAMIILYFLHA